MNRAILVPRLLADCYRESMSALRPLFVLRLVWRNRLRDEEIRAMLLLRHEQYLLAKGLQSEVLLEGQGIRRYRDEDRSGREGFAESLSEDLA